MSADNGIYIAQFSDGYRVTHASAIENIDYYPRGSKERKKELKHYFGKSKVFKTRNNAFLEAKKIEVEILKGNMPIIEYGICYLGKY